MKTNIEFHSQTMKRSRYEPALPPESGNVVGRVLVTGSRGFIGARVSTALRLHHLPILLMSRTNPSGDGVVKGDLLEPDSLHRLCEGVEAVIHCAGHVHEFDSRGAYATLRHYETNVIGTRNLVEAAGSAGVRRFVFLSSVKAMGAPGGKCVNESWPALPTTAYGRSKREAERIVLDAGERYGMEVTNLRLAMVYGRGGRGNLERMARAVRAGWFPPLPETGGKRSLVHVTDVVDVIVRVLFDRASRGKTYIVADSQAYSGAEIYDLMCRLAGRSPPAHRIPSALLRLAGVAGDVLGRVLGQPFALRSEVIERVLGPECYSAEAIRLDLGWQAQVSLQEGLRELIEIPASTGHIL